MHSQSVRLGMTARKGFLQESCGTHQQALHVRTLATVEGHSRGEQVRPHKALLRVLLDVSPAPLLPAYTLVPERQQTFARPSAPSGSARDVPLLLSDAGTKSSNGHNYHTLSFFTVIRSRAVSTNDPLKLHFIPN